MDYSLHNLEHSPPLLTLPSIPEYHLQDLRFYKLYIIFDGKINKKNKRKSDKLGVKVGMNKKAKTLPYHKQKPTSRLDAPTMKIDSKNVNRIQVGT